MLLLEIVLETLRPETTRSTTQQAFQLLPRSFPDLEAGKSTVLAHKTLSEHA